MKYFFKTKGKQLTAAVLSAVMCLMALPMSAFAFTAEEGKSVEAYYGSYYLGSDGEYYYSTNYDFIAYDDNGNTSLHSHSGGGKRAKLMVKDGSGERQLMCIESGVDYNAGGSYESTSGKNSAYFQNLPASAQYGIMLTSLYGWQPGKTAPISGTNGDDFSIATQVILWEYQQQLRTSPTTLKENSYGIRADNYFRTIQGRPAEKCYNWILSQMETHSTVPSFASNQAGNAQTYTLKYNQAQDNYSLTLTDTNNLLTDIHFTSDKGIAVTRNGNEYTFTSKKMIENAVSVSAQKTIPTAVGNLLVWGHPGKQTMVSGAEDLVYYLFALCRFAASCQSRRCGGNAGVGICSRAALSYTCVLVGSVKMSNGEIDFVAVRQNEKIYVQVTQEIHSEKTEKREYNRLLEIHDNYPKYVLTTDEFAGGNYEGIKTMHIVDFLLSSEY